ncbi:Cro/C1 family helix-turn-helix protein [Buttiauxella gaviniae ATCC 51604]|uniref:Cro/C1 family helix-turn-helix protein n=1 Tax=Buttiauxella gaviniae ATCC 51604 TaxID=1354253 RepID=A0A1B7HSR3_9ENTR|nr:S24 family peptidase [Buttiauxella gaviniae]OAT18679.1 Cro/C1 family helix-turn-helix protein [Buttiauxella gaviniae ATCC 51604]
MAGKKESILQFSERLKSIVPSGSGREFAKRAGIGYSTFHNYLQAVSSPTLENLVLLAKAGNVSVEWLATGKEFKGVAHNLVLDAGKSNVCKVPFNEGDEFLLLDLKNFPSFQGNTEHLIALRVNADVMEPTFTVGSILIIDQSQKNLREGKVIVMRKGTNYLYKRVQIVSEGYSLNSDNARYNEILVSEDALSTFDTLGEAVLVLNQL